MSDARSESSRLGHVEAVGRIEQARAEGAWMLDLGDLPLDELPEELGSLTALRVLALGKMSPRCGDDGIKWEYEDSRPEQQFTDLSVLKGLTALHSLNLYACSGVTELSPLAGADRPAIPRSLWVLWRDGTGPDPVSS